MKKFSQFSKKIFTLSLAGILAFGVFTANANANLKVIPRDLNALKTLFQQKGNYKTPASIVISCTIVSNSAHAYTKPLLIKPP